MAQCTRPSTTTAAALVALLGALACHPASAALADVPATAVPVSVSVDATTLANSRVTMCELDWSAYRANPARYPMFKDFVAASNCDGLFKSHKVSFGELEAEYAARGCGVGADGDVCAPSGMVFHEARCGSTLAANMMAVLPGSLTYSEPSSVLMLLEADRLPAEDKAYMLRVILAAMGRPIAAGAGSHLFFKFSSGVTPHMHLFRAAFPATPWIFMHREPLEVLMSLFSDAPSLPKPSAAADVHISAQDVIRSPCMRNRGTPRVPAFVATLTGAREGGAAMDVHAEEYCSAHSAYLCATAVHELLAARQAALDAVLPEPSSRDAGGECDLLDPESCAAAAPERLASHGGMLLDAKTRTGVIAGVGQGAIVDYATMPEAMLTVLRTHFNARGTLVLGDAEVARVEAVAGKYSKARDLPGSGSTDKPRLRKSLDSTGKFLPDSDIKRSAAWPTLKAAAAKYLGDIRELMLQLDATAPSTDGHFELGALSPTTKAAGGGAAASKAGAGTAAAAAAVVTTRSVPPDADVSDVRMLPLGGGYPQLFPLTEILGYWNPDIVTPPAAYGKYSSLRVFDYETEREEAQRYRMHEVPFVVRNVPVLERTVDLWGNDSYLISSLGANTKLQVEINEGSNHFMYYHKQSVRRHKDYRPPTQEGTQTFPEWLDVAYKVERDVRAEDMAVLPAWWHNDHGGAPLNDGAVKPASAGAPSAAAVERDSAPHGMVAPPGRAQRTLYYMRRSVFPDRFTGRDFMLEYVSCLLHRGALSIHAHSRYTQKHHTRVHVRELSIAALCRFALQ